MALTCNSVSGGSIGMQQTLSNNSGIDPVTLKYSTDGTTWTSWTYNSQQDSGSTVYTFDTINVAEGDTVYFKGDNSTGIGYGTSETGNPTFVLTGSMAASGNIMSLLYEDDFENEVILPTDCVFARLFKGNRTLTSAPELPATTLTENCYTRMFEGCSALTSAPELPAVTLANWCYNKMFQNCSNLNYIKAMFTNADAATHI
jgi:hypothetical protein